MLSKSFKQTLAEALKTHYNIDFHRIKKSSSKGRLYQDFNLYTKVSGLSCILNLRVNLSDDLENNENLTFKVSSSHIGCLYSSIKINSILRSELIHLAIQDVKKECSFLKSIYPHGTHNSVRHDSICLISGFYKASEDGFNIVEINTVMETNGAIFAYFSYSDLDVCVFNIVGEQLFVKPLGGYDKKSSFDIPSSLNEQGMKIFKANLSKCLLMLASKKFSRRFNHKEDDYMHLNYEELKQYFLVLEMEKI
jgi:hypothetical protein